MKCRFTAERCVAFTGTGLESFRRPFRVDSSNHISEYPGIRILDPDPAGLALLTWGKWPDMGGCRAAWAILALSFIHTSSSELPAMRLDASPQARHRGLSAQNCILPFSNFKETIAFSYPMVRFFNHFSKASFAVPGTQHRGELLPQRIHGEEPRTCHETLRLNPLQA